MLSLINKYVKITFICIITIANFARSEGLTVKSPKWHGGSPPMGLITTLDAEISIPFMPKVGQEFEITLVLVNHGNSRREQFGPDYVVGFSGKGVDIVQGKEIRLEGYLVSEDIVQFKAKAIIRDTSKTISVFGGISAKGWPGPQGIGFTLYLLDEKTGQYGTREEYEKLLRQSAEWWYDRAGEFTGDPVSPICAEENRKIIAKMKELEPGLTGWEALYLHYDGIQTLMGGMGTKETTDEGRWKFLLEQGWLEKQRQGKDVKDIWLKELINKYKGKSLRKEEGLNPIFFRGDSIDSYNSPNITDSTKVWSYIYFKGQFRYKKHKYNNSQALLAETDDIPICSVLVRVRCWWLQSGGSHWSFRTNTDASGNFLATLGWEVPQDYEIYAHPLIYFWGPEPSNRIIHVSDTLIP